MDQLASFDFKPGQFVTLDLPIHEKANKRWRSYSIASAPDGTNVFELIIVLDEQGTGTNFLFHEVKVGDSLTLRGPLGVFTLKEPLDKDIYFICTGTGVAPFRSMIRHIIDSGRHHKNIRLIFGCRSREDLLYHEEFKKLAESPGFDYIPVLSRDTWDGRTGHVHEVYEELCASRPPADFYLCGWRGMIDEAREKLKNLGYESGSVHFELYG